MNSSMPNTKPHESAKPPINVSEEAKNRANRQFAELEAQRAVEGLRNLAKQKAARKAPDQAA